MDWWTAIKIIWGGLGLAAVGLVLVAAWRARGVISWNRSIRKELNALAAEARTAAPARQAAIGLVVDACTDVLRSLSPAQGFDAEHLRIFIRSIAACYFPIAERPELQISLDRLIDSLDACLYRFDRIVHRPGLKRLRSVNIGTIHGFYRWSGDLAGRPWARWYLAHHRGIQRLMLMRLFVIPDPLSWLLFLSRKLLVLMLLKCLLVDVTLFVGRLAADAYDRECERPAAEDADALEATLEALSQVDLEPAVGTDPEIAAIRKALVGFTAVLRATPSFRDWKAAVRDAAEILARRYFPDTDRPLEKAAIGPLLDRTRAMLATVARSRNILVVRYVFQTRLETLFQARDIGDMVLTPTVRGMFRTAATAYGWVKWPLKIYRRVKRFSLPGIAADVGWVVGKKSALILIYGRSFDLACRELDGVYRHSAAMAGAATAHPAGIEAKEDGESSFGA